MLNLSELARGGTVCLSKAGLAIGTTTESTVDIAAPNGAGVDYAINGILYHKADTATIAITAAAVQAASTSCLYLICLNSSGTLSSVKGEEVLTADITTNKRVLNWPLPLANTCPIGAVRVDVAAGYTFTAGTTLFSATGMTDTYYDLFMVPDTPLTA